MKAIRKLTLNAVSLSDREMKEVRGGYTEEEFVNCKMNSTKDACLDTTRPCGKTESGMSKYCIFEKTVSESSEGEIYAGSCACKVQ